MISKRPNKAYKDILEFSENMFPQQAPFHIVVMNDKDFKEYEESKKRWIY